MNHGSYLKVMFVALQLASVAGLCAENGFVAHEWGTFTSLQGADGKVLDGMYHEEEALPDFVHGRCKLAGSGQRQGAGPGLAMSLSYEPAPDPCENTHCPKCCAPGDNVRFATQKMETPVIYFYSKTPRRVRVDVDFPGGLITQYYPSVADFSPRLGEGQGLANGHVSWDLRDFAYAAGYSICKSGKYLVSVAAGELKFCFRPSAKMKSWFFIAASVISRPRLR